MISDILGLGHRYVGLHSAFATAFEFLHKLPADQPLGRFEIAGDDCFALVQSYTTKPLAQAAFEAHERYIDIQFIQAGQETLLWAPRSLLQIAQPYKAEKDIAFYALPPRFTPVNLSAGEFAVFFPEDGHAPGIESGGPATVRKVVIKIRV